MVTAIPAIPRDKVLRTTAWGNFQHHTEHQKPMIGCNKTGVRTVCANVLYFLDVLRISGYVTQNVVVDAVLDLGFTTLVTSQLISVAFFSEREKSDKFCSGALNSAWDSFTCRRCTTRDPWLYFPSEGSHTKDFYALKNSIDPGRDWTRERRIQWRQNVVLVHRSLSNILFIVSPNIFGNISRNFLRMLEYWNGICAILVAVYFVCNE